MSRWLTTCTYAIERSVTSFADHSEYKGTGSYTIYLRLICSDPPLAMSVESRPPELDKLFEGDGYLRTHESDLLLRWNRFAHLESSLETNEGGLAQFAYSYKHYGIVQRENGDVEVSEITVYFMF